MNWGSNVVLYSGNFFISFTNAAPSIGVRFIVEELATSKRLQESQDTSTLSQWPTSNIYNILVPENIIEISHSRDFATCPCPLPALYTGIFTRVGKIELETSVSGAPTRLISTSTGLATVPDVIANKLYIPAYNDSPFGGNLYLFGAFSQILYDLPNIYYRIRMDTPGGGSPQYLKDPLEKTKYSINMTALPLTVQTDRVPLGPFYHGTIPYYQLTPMAGMAGPVQFFWSFPDLLALWNTGGRNGEYTLTLEVFSIDPLLLTTTPTAPVVDPPSVPGFCPAANFTNLKLFLDNVAPVADIMAIDTAVGAPHTPYIYTPADPATITGPYYVDRQGTMGDYGPISNPICSILEFTQPSQRLAFKLTAYHANGYLRYWKMSFRRNNTGYADIIGKYYSGGGVMQDYAPLVISPWPESTVNGFQGKFLYLTPANLNLGSPDGCGYRFVIEAGTRTTDGYYYLHWGRDEDIHYIKQ